MKISNAGIPILALKMMRALVLPVLCLLPWSEVSFAQMAQQANEAAFARVISFVNERRGDSVYNMLSNGFKAKISKEMFTSVLENNLYPMGKISTHELMKFDKGVSVYKATAGTTALEFRIAVNDSGAIKALRFRPYEAEKTVAVPTDNPLQTDFDRHIDTIARHYINKVNTVGLSIAIEHDGKSYFYGYGTTKKGENHLPGPDAAFEIGSVTKTFTATLLAYYANEHKVSLTDAITRYLPDSVVANAALQHITLQMLANHTSGLPRVPGNIFTNNTDPLNPYKDYHREQLFAYLKNCKPLTTPGEKYAYSNLGGGLLAVILERVSGLTYDQMVTEVICNPLGMSSTFLHPDAAQRAREVSVYDDSTEEVQMWDIDALAGAGAIRSTAHDMLQYTTANLHSDNTPLSKAMALTHNITYNKEMSIGLGWHTGKDGETTYYWHNGATGGCRSYAAFIPGKDAALVMLSNSAAPVDETAIELLKFLDNGVK